MEKLMLSEIIQAVRGSYGYPADVEVKDISTDTRTITEGSLFIALKGANFDGHDFAAQAMEAGAVAVVTERPVDGARCLIVDSTSQALLDAASYYRSRFDIPLVGITGSVGKTTTKEMIWSVMSKGFKTLKTEANHNNEVGMPKTLLELDSTHQAAVIEMGMNHKGEISRMSTSCKPTVCVITNIGVSHIENLGSQEGILKAKMEILDGASADAPLILSRDDRILSKVQVYGDRKIWYYSVSKKDSDVYASDIAADSKGISFTIHYAREKLPARINCLGEHNVKNALAAFCVGAALGMDNADIIAGLADFRPEGMRQNIIEENGVTYILDCYNAAPDSMKASLSVLGQVSVRGRRIAVLGDMLELGKGSTRYHRTVGEYVKNSKTDILLCFGKNSNYYIEGACDKGFDRANTAHFDSREELAEHLKGILKEGDAVLFKGSRGMKLEEVYEAIKQA
ncbi:UDP-N-acetylmuramoyl-tripeptide--D-alanyl-D-alanine ligase [Ruminococcus albus]|uniref:UDP-N-acetylmuramoyl-tripeptide--D-alanyl-D-alanine ligase n=1 Tax=Ruminococcus albus 8 TaxID=246199 RepID=E9SB78_RUMAL|nr:UDP-N-acetylmuramoyl-tripeptide--D-alanyl-D-alanine ligase [Ruminococcus albus]EGC03462.1 UDP-N-acetylmuramoyl-tripeptide--D-alanyl-D-alanine ligase [Ruminococcus albus 8]MCC3350232.1 UDP-N-acetylmuramoyl-tripeptide--D-alanyl-D-alanine ligase [Ruminococcus albus 8]